MSWEYGNEHGGFANQLAGMRLYLDYPHIASIACPKPMYFINGRDDKLFKLPGVNSAFDTMRQTWESQNAGSKLKTEILPMPHHCGLEVQKKALDFFNKNL